MNIRNLTLASIAVAFCALITVTTDAYAVRAKAADRFITIGTGGVTGVYYPAGGAICRLVNKGRRHHGIRCSVESTGGSIDNLIAVRSGEIAVAVAQSDWQHHAYKGTDFFSKIGKMEDLRSLFSLHSEPFTVIVRRDSGIKTLDGLKGHIVNIGNPGSGMRATMDFIMKQKNWEPEDFKKLTELKISDQAQALCAGQIDAMIYAAGHPNGAVQEVTTSCDTVILSIKDTDIDNMVRDYPYYAYTTIPGGMYAGNDQDITTIGVKATFVAMADLDEEIAYQLVKSVFDNFDNFRRLHPVFSILDKENMVLEGNTAPIHKGALRYYREKEMLQ